jgi:dihydroneopterin aldolase
MSGDTIEIRGLRVMGRHGVFAAERAQPQPFVVDLVLQVDLRAAGASDALDDTVDYGAVAAMVGDIIVDGSVRLIETLAERIATQVLTVDRVTQVRVRVAKPEAPIDADFETVAVEITRGRTP